MEAIGDAVGVADLPCYLERFLDAAYALLQPPALPEEDSRGGSGHHTGVGAEPKSAGIMDLRVVKLDRPFEVRKAGFETPTEGGGGSKDIVALDQHRVVARLLTELDQLLSQVDD